MLLVNKFNQGKCPSCHSWHFAVELDDNKNLLSLKCCRCGIIYKVKGHLLIRGEND